MSQPIRIESVDQTMLERSIRTGVKYEFAEMELMITGLIQMLGITSEEKAYIDDIARMSGDYPIDAEAMMKQLGIVSQTSDSAHISRAVVRSINIPKMSMKDLVKKACPTAVGLAPEVKKAYPPAGGYAPDELSLFKNSNCEIVRVGAMKDGQIRHSYKYRLAITAAHKVLMRAYNDDKYADYLSIQLQLIEKYKKYQSDYSSYLKDISMRQKDDKIDELKTMIQDQSNEIKNQSTQISELLGYAKDTKESLQVANENIVDLQDTLEVTREEVVENRMRVIETHLKVVQTNKVVEEIDEMLRDKSIMSTMNPQAEQYVHHALVMVKSFGNERKIVLRSGQSAYIDTCKRKLSADGFEVLFDKFYQANGIDYRRNVQSRILDSIEIELAPFNKPIIERRESLKAEIAKRNASLPDEIAEYNSELIARVDLHNETATDKTRIYLASSKTFYRWKGIQVYGKRRNYEKECRSYEKEVRNAQYQLLTVDIDVNSKVIYWKPNEYISYNSLVGMIEEVNVQTQSSPRDPTT